MTKDPDTQVGQPSGQDPLKANRRLGLSRALFPIIVSVVLAVIFGPEQGPSAVTTRREEARGELRLAQSEVALSS